MNGVLRGNENLIAAAHELKSPLVLVRQLALMIQDGGLTNAEKQRLLEQITLTSDRALRLTSDLTRSSRLNDTLFELEPINPLSLCEDIVHELSPLFKAHGRDIKLMPRKHRLLMIANRDLLRRIIVTFSDNALHYSDKDAPVELQINECDNGKTVRLGVRDYGPAVSTDVWKSLQHKLSRAPQPLHARPQSSGLGLYIAGQFADVMNGQIGVTRHSDGATFYVDLQSSRQLNLL